MSIQLRVDQSSPLSEYAGQCLRMIEVLELIQRNNRESYAAQKKWNMNNREKILAAKKDR